MSGQLSKEGNNLAKRFPTLVHPRRVGRDFQKTAAAISEKGAYRAENGGTLFMGTQNRTALPPPPPPLLPEDRPASEEAPLLVPFSHFD